MRFLRLLLFASLVLLAALVSFLGGYFYHSIDNQPFLTHTIVEEAYRVLDKHALNGIPGAPAIEYGMIRGMVTALNDPYTIFVEPIRHELETDDLRGEFGGIGVRLERNQEGLLLMYPYPDSPAEKSGIQIGDVLISVDQLHLDDQTPLEAVEAALRGEIGKTVGITFLRSGDPRARSTSITRAAFNIPSVTWNLDQEVNQLGIVQISRFASTTPQETINAIEALKSMGATHFVLDLRNNPGGLLDAGIDTARLFLTQGTVLMQQYKNQPEIIHDVKSPGAYHDIPLAVIVNQGTASAAEVLAGALQAHQRAQIYGQPTYGKDTLQLVFELSDHSSLHVTAARWWIPGLYPPITGNGVIPDRLTTTDPAAIRPEIQTILKDFSLNS